MKRENKEILVLCGVLTAIVIVLFVSGVIVRAIFDKMNEPDEPSIVTYKLDMNHFLDITCDSTMMFSVSLDTMYDGFEDFVVADDFASSYLAGADDKFLEDSYEIRIIRDFDGSRRAIIMRANY